MRKDRVKGGYCARPVLSPGRVAPERGAAAVEFAIVASLLLTLVLGAIDFGWVLSQNVATRSAAREGARLAVVNGGQGGSNNARRDDLISQIQRRATNLNSSLVQVFVNLEDTNGNGTVGDQGDNAVICVRYPARSLSGFFAPFFNGNMDSKAVMRMEQFANFSTGGSTSPAWSGGSCIS